jgi:hypothetical protein
MTRTVTSGKSTQPTTSAYPMTELAPRAATTTDARSPDDIPRKHTTDPREQPH